jgi:hypothetical protein
MKLSKRTSLVIILLGLVILLGILLRAFLYENLVRPMALVFLVFWRIVLSVDQQYYWFLLIVAAVLYIFYRITRMTEVAEETQLPPSNDTLETLRYWRTSIMLTSDETSQNNMLRRDLWGILAMMVAIQQPGKSQIELYDALKQRQIPLPENIYSFLFPSEPPITGGSLSRLLQSVWLKLARWRQRLSGREIADYYLSIEEVLNFMETAMEMKNDNESNDSNN